MFRRIERKSRLLMGLKKAPADMSLVKFVFYYGRNLGENQKLIPEWREGPQRLLETEKDLNLETSSESECEEECADKCQGQRMFYCENSLKGTRPTNSDYVVYELDEYKSMLDHEQFDKEKNTVLYLHGYLEDTKVESVCVIVEAYLERNDTNIIVLHWGELAKGNYIFDASVNAKQLAPVLADKLIKMFDEGLNIQNFHLVGHSLGGQMAGMVGNHIRKLTADSKVLKRISALDPAFPLYYLVRIFRPLRKKDALFVDVIHTDAWLYGAPFRTGTVDFWPNGGKTLQPGCPKRNYKMLSDNDLSSHRRSWWFWAESVADLAQPKFIAVKAKSWRKFKAGNLLEPEAPIVIMGHNCPTHITGNYYLQTNGTLPFARGQDGTKYIDPKELTGYLYEANFPRKSKRPTTSSESILSTAK